MSSMKITALAAALVMAAGVGATFAPVAHGQTAAAPRARSIQVFGGSGSQIGVSVRDTDEAQGVLVEDVTADSPAATAGIKKGDVVTEFDGERVRSVRQFRRLVSETPGGRKVAATVVRAGQRVSVSVQPRANEASRVFDNFDWDFDFAFPPTPPAPPAAPTPGTPPKPPAPPEPPLPWDLENFIWRVGSAMGVSVQELSPQLSEYFGVKDGVLVTSVTEQSPAAKAGLKAGDVITGINGTLIESSTALRRQIQRLNAGEDFTVAVTRDRKSLTVKGKMDEARNRRSTLRPVL